MTFIELVFYGFSAIAIASAVMVVVSRNSVRAALFLVLSFVASSGLWILLRAEFLALILVLVYVGAVMTLFLFVVMMLSMQGVIARESFVRYLPLSAFIVLLVIGVLVAALGPFHFGLNLVPAPAAEPANYSNTADLGSVLYTQYALPFEVGGMILLAAIVAAISLAHRDPIGRKSQNTSQQIAVRREDRVRLIKMPAVKKNQSSGAE